MFEQARAQRDAMRAKGGVVPPEARHCSSVHGGEESNCRDPQVRAVQVVPIRAAGWAESGGRQVCGIGG